MLIVTLVELPTLFVAVCLLDTSLIYRVFTSAEFPSSLQADINGAAQAVRVPERPQKRGHTIVGFRQVPVTAGINFTCRREKASEG